MTQHRLPFLTLALLTVLFFLGILVHSKYGIPWDAQDQFYPNMFFMVESLKHGTFPLWNPHVFSGFPAFADPQAGLFYPLNYLLFLASIVNGLSYKLFEIYVVFHYFLAGLFMYVFLKSILSSRFAALVGAIVFMFSGMMAAHAQHVTTIMAAAWIPLIFHFSAQACHEANIRSALWAGLFLGIQILAGHPQTSVYTMLAVIVYFVWMATLQWGEQKHCSHFLPFLKSLFSLLISAVCLAAIQIIPTIELTRLSIRNELANWEKVDLGGLDPIQLITFFLPNFFGGLSKTGAWFPREFTDSHYYMGILGIMLAIIGIRFIQRSHLVWIVLGAFFFVLALADRLCLPVIFYHLFPPLNLFVRHTNFLWITTFAISILTALGAEEILKPTSPVRAEIFLKKIFTAGLLLLGLGLVFMMIFPFMAKEYEYRSKLILSNYSIAVFFFFAGLGTLWLCLKRKFLPISQACALVFLVIVIDLFSFNSHQLFNFQKINIRAVWSLESMADSEVAEIVHQDTRNGYRVAFLAAGSQWNNAGPIANYRHIFGYNPIALSTYVDAITTISGAFNRQPRFDTAPNLQSPFLNLLAVKHILTVDSFQRGKNLFFPEPQFKKIYGNGWIKTYENQSALPRAYWSRQAFVFAEGSEVLSSLEAGRGNSDAPIAVLAKESKGIPSNAITPSPIYFEAENSAQRTNHGGTVSLPLASGRACLGYGWAGAVGDYAQFAFTEDSPFPALVIEFRYASNSPGSAILSVFLDDEKTARADFKMPMTGGWGESADHWKWLSQTLGPISQGKHTLRITSQTAVPVNLDLIALNHAVSSEIIPPQYNPIPAVVEDSLNRTAISVNAPSAGFVVLSDVNYPGWEAEIDGIPAGVITANYISRAVYVPSGPHKVVFKFRPKSFYVGLMTSIMALILIVYLMRRASRDGRGRLSSEL